MQVPRGTSLRAALTAARLLEDEDLDFYSVLQQREGNLDIMGSGQRGEDDSPVGQMEIWWTVEIEARRWGIKDITPHIKKLVLDGAFDDYHGRSTGEAFRYEYPEPAQPVPEIGPDPDAPTPDNVARLAAPKWKLDYQVDRNRPSRTSFHPEAEVDLDRRTIEIKF